MSRGNIVHTSYSFLAKGARRIATVAGENTEKKIFIVRKRIATVAEKSVRISGNQYRKISSSLLTFRG